MKISYEKFIGDNKERIDRKVSEIKDHVSIIGSEKNRQTKFKEEMRMFKNELIKEYSLI